MRRHSVCRGCGRTWVWSAGRGALVVGWDVVVPCCGGPRHPPVRISNELLQDTQVNAAELVRRAFWGPG